MNAGVTASSFTSCTTMTVLQHQDMIVKLCLYPYYLNFNSHFPSWILNIISSLVLWNNNMHEIIVPPSALWQRWKMFQLIFNLVQQSFIQYVLRVRQYQVPREIRRWIMPKNVWVKKGDQKLIHIIHLNLLSQHVLSDTHFLSSRFLSLWKHQMRHVVHMKQFSTIRQIRSLISVS